MKTMSPLDYHHIDFVATHSKLRSCAQVHERSCHKATVVITERTHCFHDSIFITPILLLWNLSTLCVCVFWITYNHLYIIYIYIYILHYIHISIYNTYIYIHINIHIHTHIYIHIYIHINICTYIIKYNKKYKQLSRNRTRHFQDIIF